MSLIMKNAINILNEVNKEIYNSIYTMVNTLHHNGYYMFIDNDDLHILYCFKVGNMTLN